MYVDTREPGPFPERIKKDFKAETKLLEAGDYYITKDEGGIVVERSTFADFIGKIKSGRLQEQVRKCKEVSDDVYFLLENPHSAKWSGMPKASIIGAMMSLTRQGVHVMVAQNAGDSYHVIRYLYDKYHSKRKMSEGEVRPKPRHQTPRQQAIYALMGLNGIGEKTAKELLKGTDLHGLVTDLIEGGPAEGAAKRHWKVLTDVLLAREDTG